MKLRGAQLAILLFGGIVVEDLQFHADVGSVPFERRADAEAIVRPLLQLELEAENEIAILFLREQIAAAPLAQ